MIHRSRERELLVALLAAVENPARAADLPEQDEALTEVARRHRLSPLLSAVCGDALPGALAEHFRRDRIIVTARNMILQQVAEECVGALANAEIPAIVLKGLDYGLRLYPAAGSRAMADVDLLIPGETRRMAFRIMDGLGFEPRAAAPGFDEADYHEVAWTRSGVEVDLHMALAPLARCRIDYIALWHEVQARRLGSTNVHTLGARHAAIFQALHMAIDHFGVPAIYLVDLARLLPDAEALRTAAVVAQAWHCNRPLATSIALAGSLLPHWKTELRLGPPPTFSRRVVDAYGGSAPLPRPEQLWRKITHFDVAGDALRYISVQSRRNVRELVERRLRGRSARERLGL